MVSVMNNTSISIIIVSYNTEKVLLDCLDSIYPQIKKKAIEIIVVDNASKDKSVERLKQKFPLVKIIENQDNVGFGKANNQGVSRALGDWVLLLNSDTVVKSNFISSIESIIKNHELGVFGFKLLNKDGSIQPSAGFFPTLKRVLLQMLFLDDLPWVKEIYKPYQQSNSRFYLKTQEVDWVTGACILMPKAIYEKSGGFDESIFMYGEELDLCLRIKQLGYKVKYLTSPEIYHLKGASSNDGFKAAVIGEYHGSLYFYQKHYPRQIALLKLFLGLGALLRVFVFAMINQKKAITYVEALKIVIHRN